MGRTACPAGHGGLAKTTAQPVGGGSWMWEPDCSYPKASPLGFFTVCWLGYVCPCFHSVSCLSAVLCLRPCLHPPALPEVLFTVFVLSNYKFSILPLTYIYPPHAPACLLIPYSFFQQTAFIQDQAPACQGGEREVKQTHPCPRRGDEDRVPLLCAAVGLILRRGRQADLLGPRAGDGQS